MPKIEGFRIQNFRALKDVTIGKLWNTQQKSPLTAMTVVIGKNGVGKSTLFDAFGFLADCLKNGVEEACDLQGRSGFEQFCDFNHACCYDLIRNMVSDGLPQGSLWYSEFLDAG